MNRIIKNVSRLSVLVLSLFLWSCDDIGQTVGPESDLSPRGYAIFSTTTGEQYVVIREDESLGVVSGSIGSAGGELHIGTHTLHVPSGAVSEPTVFSMSRSDDDLLRIKLSATRVDHNDIGASGFDVPVKLTIDFTEAEDMPEDASQLEVLFFRPDGLVEPFSTHLDVEAGKATGDLPHFSDYG
ncbi:MAG: hypothetical protein WD766_15105, partial [Gemmatimonadota bacterium]